MVAQQSGADRVERARPGEPLGHDRCLVTEHPGSDALDAARHFRGGPAREGHEQDASRIGAVHDQVRNTVRQRSRLARSRTGDDQQRRSSRTFPMHHGGQLLGVEAGKVVVWFRGGHSRIKDSKVHCANESCFRFVRNKDRPGEGPLSRIPARCDGCCVRPNSARQRAGTTSRVVGASSCWKVASKLPLVARGQELLLFDPRSRSIRPSNSR